MSGTQPRGTSLQLAGQDAGTQRHEGKPSAPRVTCPCPRATCDAGGTWPSATTARPTRCCPTSSGAKSTAARASSGPARWAPRPLWWCWTSVPSAPRTRSSAPPRTGPSRSASAPHQLPSSEARVRGGRGAPHLHVNTAGRVGEDLGQTRTAHHCRCACRDAGTWWWRRPIP